MPPTAIKGKAGKVPLKKGGSAPVRKKTHKKVGINTPQKKFAKSTNTLDDVGELEIPKPNGPITMDELLDRLCPQIEFETEELVEMDHPILGKKLRWIPTPISSSDPIRQLYYILTDPNPDDRGDLPKFSDEYIWSYREDDSESARTDLVQKMASRHTIRSLTSKALESLSRQLDTNIVIIQRNKIVVGTPDMKSFNLSRYTCLAYHDGECYHAVDNSQDTLHRLLKRTPASFGKIVLYDDYD
jgi:hypothetical protein